MKTSNLFKAVVLVAMMVASVVNSEVKAQDNFITNEEVSGELVTSKTIFRKDGAYLYKHIRYNFTYDNQNRLTGKEASKWDAIKEEWAPYFKLTYQYDDKEITMNYARWNESRKAFDDAVQKSVYELNDANMPTVYKTFKQNNNEKSDWTLVSFKKVNRTESLLASAR